MSKKQTRIRAKRHSQAMPAADRQIQLLEQMQECAFKASSRQLEKKKQILNKVTKSRNKDKSIVHPIYSKPHLQSPTPQPDSRKQLGEFTFLRNQVLTKKFLDTI